MLQGTLGPNASGKAHESEFVRLLRFPGHPLSGTATTFYAPRDSFFVAVRRLRLSISALTIRQSDVGFDCRAEVRIPLARQSSPLSPFGNNCFAT